MPFLPIFSPMGWRRSAKPHHQKYRDGLGIHPAGVYFAVWLAVLDCAEADLTLQRCRVLSWWVPATDDDRMCVVETGIPV
jgi:hypothetical protein